jgi:1,4-dihydroxy-2-naphthoate octaprenyltransferase
MILLLGVLGMGIGFFYSAPPVAASYHQFGELFVAAGFGPLIVVGSYVVQTGVWNVLPLLASIPIALLIAGVLFLNEFPDFDADRRAGKFNLVNTVGKEKSVGFLSEGIAIAFVLVLFFVLLGKFPLWSLGVFLTLPIGWHVISHTRKNYDKILELIPANASMITLNFLFGVLLTLAFVAGAFI